MYYYFLDISPHKPSLQWEKYSSVGHAIDRSVQSIQNRFSFAPLLHYDYKNIFKIRSLKTTALSKKKIALSFKDT